MGKFVAVHVSNKKHFGEVHVAGCCDLAKGEYPTQELSTPEQARSAIEGSGGHHEGDEWVTDFPTIYAPCVRKGGK